MIEILGQYNEKGIYFLSGDIRQLYTDIEGLNPYFVCAIFLHKYDWGEEELRALIEGLIKHGAAYFVFHGNKCEQAHDIADHVHALVIPENEITYDNVIGTTWFENDSEDEAIFSAVCCSLPAEDYLDQFSSFVIISLGTESESNYIRGLLNNLESTIKLSVARANGPH